MISRDKSVPARPAQELVQAILRITITPDRSVEVAHCLGVEQPDGQFIQEAGSVVISTFRGAEYEELMKPFPSWSPKKPAGTFRAEDIFALLDFIEAGGMNPVEPEVPVEEAPVENE